jgi:hypothetical protein
MTAVGKVPTFQGPLTVLADSFEVSVRFTRLQIIHMSEAGSIPHYLLLLEFLMLCNNAKFVFFILN